MRPFDSPAGVRAFLREHGVKAACTIAPYTSPFTGSQRFAVCFEQDDPSLRAEVGVLLSRRNANVARTLAWVPAPSRPAPPVRPRKASRRSATAKDR